VILTKTNVPRASALRLAGVDLLARFGGLGRGPVFGFGLPIVRFHPGRSQA
jgi:hypothetical protein